MSTEVPKYWPQIQALREAKVAAAKEAVTQAARERNGYRKLRAEAVQVVYDILTELKENDPGIQQAPLKQIRVFSSNPEDDQGTESMVDPDNTTLLRLRWGNKLGLTAEEIEFLSRYEYKQPAANSLSVIPDKIIAVDYVYIDVNLGERSLEITNRKTLGYRDIINDPANLLIALGDCVDSPPRGKYFVCQKGINYWKEPPRQPRQPSSPLAKLARVFGR